MAVTAPLSSLTLAPLAVQQPTILILLLKCISLEPYWQKMPASNSNISFGCFTYLGSLGNETNKIDPYVVVLIKTLGEVSCWILSHDCILKLRQFKMSP
jgi:hypothetical protein